LGLGEAAAIGAAIVTSILGSFVRFSSLVSNDALSWLLGGLAVYFWLKAEENPATGRHFLFWSLVMIAGLFTKLSLLLLLPLPILSSVLQRRWKRSLCWLLWAMVVVLATVPLWIRNVQGFDSLLPLAAGFGEPNAGAPFSLPAWAYAARSLFFPWQEFWCGWLGGLLVLGVVLACAYLLISSIAQLKNLRFPIPCALLFLASLGAFVWLNLSYFQAEGRYLLVSWPVWVALLGVGGRSVVRQWVLLGLLLAPYLLFFVPFLEGAYV
ncbi:MAG: hypothetical protein V1784_02405, partial [bacterium]